MISRSRKNVGAIGVAVVITLVLGACVGDEAGASQGTTKLANPTTGPAVTGPTETGPTEPGPTEPGDRRKPHLHRASAVEAGMCSDGARWRLEVADPGGQPPAGLHHPRGWIRVRFEVRQSPVGHEWRIRFRNVEHNITPGYGRVFFRGTSVASDSGVLVVEARHPDWSLVDGVDGGAVDRQTGQVCKVFAWYRD